MDEKIFQPPVLKTTAEYEAAGDFCRSDMCTGNPGSDTSHEVSQFPVGEIFGSYKVLH